ncbi:MAG: fumarylacetoacetate hydrolase family protein [Parcubacteria group bacterium]|nr:fumarylacetoacetate hydrolase family protein [Parcubacteria group bacterium]
MRQIRARRGEQIPSQWYQRPYFYALSIQREKMRAHGDKIYFPGCVQKRDYEFEILGIHLKPIYTRNIQVAIEHVRNNMLFCIFNDLSCRDYQALDSALPLGVTCSKGMADKAFGPVCLYGRELNMDEHGVFNLRMSLEVNGEQRCKANFNSIYFTDPETGTRKNWSFAEVITWSGHMHQGFETGDLMGSGTVGDGCIAEHSDTVPWLKDGDAVSMTVEKLGTLTNTVSTYADM